MDKLDSEEYNSKEKFFLIIYIIKHKNCESKMQMNEFFQELNNKLDSYREGLQIFRKDKHLRVRLHYARFVVIRVLFVKKYR